MKIKTNFVFKAGRPDPIIKDPDVNIRYREYSGVGVNRVANNRLSQFMIERSEVISMRFHENRVVKAKKKTLDYVRNKLNVKKFSLGQLARMGHPYSRRFPKLSLVGNKPYVMNVQSGKLREGFVLKTRYYKSSNKMFVYLNNSSDKAKYIFFSKYGTKQVHRPVFYYGVKRFSVELKNSGG